MQEIAFRSATELTRMLRAGEIGSLELTDHYIARIERIDADLNAVVVRDFERAREAARACDSDLAAGRVRGPLHGLPMTVKESYDVAGLPTTWGIPLFANNIASRDAHAVERFKRAGAVILGKTNVPLGLGDFQSYNEIYGQTNNPWDPARTPGGSSGGSAAALAAGLTGLECGSDIGGSIRNPAHFCGVYGHKPTWGIVPPQGHALPGMLAAPDIAVCGPLARSADDLELALDLISGPERLDAPAWQLALPASPGKPLRHCRVALWASDELAPVEDEIAQRVARVGEILSGLGATVSDSARPDYDIRRGHANYLKLLNSIMGASLPDAVYLASQKSALAIDPEDLSDASVTARALVLSHREWLAANNFRESIRHAWRAFFRDWDVLVCPQMATPAFAHDHSPFGQRSLEVDRARQPYFQQLFWSGLVIGAYLPSTVFPTGPSRTGLPIGLQAIGAEYHDRTTLDFARQISREAGGFQAPPAYA